MKTNLKNHKSVTCFTNRYNKVSSVIFKVLMAVTVFLDAAPCTLVKTEGNFGGADCLHHQCLIMESVTIWNCGAP